MRPLSGLGGRGLRRWGFNFQHLGAHVSQHHCTKGAGGYADQLENFYALQWAWHSSSSLRRTCVVHTPHLRAAVRASVTLLLRESNARTSGRVGEWGSGRGKKPWSLWCPSAPRLVAPSPPHSSVRRAAVNRP